MSSMGMILILPPVLTTTRCCWAGDSAAVSRSDWVADAGACGWVVPDAGAGGLGEVGLGGVGLAAAGAAGCAARPAAYWSSHLRRALSKRSLEKGFRR